MRRAVNVTALLQAMPTAGPRAGGLYEPNEQVRRSEPLLGLGMEEPLALCGVVIAARIIMHGASMVPVRGPIGAGEVLDPVGEIGLRIAQAGGVAGVAEAAGGRELDLHQPDTAAASDQLRLVAALALDHPMHQRFRHIVNLRVRPDERINLVMPG